VDGWDDPRMYTLQGLRRRGYTPAALRLFVDRIGISKQNSMIDFSVLEGALREDLDARAPRRMAVVAPLKMVLTNLAEDHEETLRFPNHPKDESFGEREVPFSRELWIERDDFAEIPPKGWKRLVPGGEVRLRGAGIVRCDEVVRNGAGDIIELHATLDPESRPGMEGANRKVKGTIHWVGAARAVEAEVRLYDRLFSVPDPDDESDGRTYRDHINPESRTSVRGYIEPAAAEAAPEDAWQFERLGYFVADLRDHRAGAPVFNRSVTLRDTWAAKAGADTRAGIGAALRPRLRQRYHACVATDTETPHAPDDPVRIHPAVRAGPRGVCGRTARRRHQASSDERAAAGNARRPPRTHAPFRAHRGARPRPQLPRRQRLCGEERRQLLRLLSLLREQGRRTRSGGGPGRLCRVGNGRRLRLPRHPGLRLRVQQLRAGRVRRADPMSLPARVNLRLPDWVHDAAGRDRAYAGNADKVALAIGLAARNIAEGTGGPFGAVLFGPDDRIVAAAVNVVVPQATSLAHAENMAYMLAQQSLGRARINLDADGRACGPYTLATSAQPCCQCFGATVWAGVDRLLIGARAED